jgi:hypothetical protein
VTPTRAQLALLKLLAAGASLEPPAARQLRYRLTVKGATVTHVCVGTVQAMIEAGWITSDRRLTPLGRARTEVGVFVRAFLEAQV